MAVQRSGLRTLTGAEALILPTEDPATFERVLAKTAPQEKLFSEVTLAVPIHGLNHWTLLVLTQQNGEVSAARYYDSLRHESQECRKRAKQILRSCTSENEIELPPRRNS